MLKKTWHWVVLIFAIVGIMYVGHMMMNHKGSQILPGVGVKA